MFRSCSFNEISFFFKFLHGVCDGENIPNFHQNDVIGNILVFYIVGIKGSTIYLNIQHVEIFNMCRDLLCLMWKHILISHYD